MMGINIFDTVSRGRKAQLCFSILLILSSLCKSAFGEYLINDTSLIEIGRPVPDISFNNVLCSAKARFSTRDLGGRPTIMYFFSTGCSGSFKKLPEINELYSRYKKDIDLILVGMDFDDNIRSIYEAYRMKYRLNLPIAFDKIQHRKYNIRTVPTVVWIKRNGIVQAVTHVVDEQYLIKFINGAEFDFIDGSFLGRKNRSAFDPSEPLFIEGNGGNEFDLIQRSMLAKWKPGMPSYVPYKAPLESPLNGLTYLQIVGAGLSTLYRLAYFERSLAWDIRDSVAYGNYHYSILFEVPDSSRFVADYLKGENLYCYSQVLPPDRRSPSNMLEVLKRDLKSCFGYEVSVETRMMPYLSLVATDWARQKIVNRGEPVKHSGSLVGIDYQNVPLEEVIDVISYFSGLVQRDLPLINETGMKKNVNISLDAILTDIEDVTTALQKQGLDIVQKKRAMKVIVIK